MSRTSPIALVVLAAVLALPNLSCQDHRAELPPVGIVPTAAPTEGWPLPLDSESWRVENRASRVSLILVLDALPQSAGGDSPLASVADPVLGGQRRFDVNDRPYVILEVGLELRLLPQPRATTIRPSTGELATPGANEPDEAGRLLLLWRGLDDEVSRTR